MSYYVTIAVLNEKALSGKPFSVREVNEETINRGDISRIDICYPTRYYFQDMVEAGFLQLTDVSGTEPLYLAADKFIRLAQAHPQCVEKGIRVDLLENLQTMAELLS